MASPASTDAPGQAPPLGAGRLLLVVTGALGAAFVPFWLNWLKAVCPGTELRTVVTPTADRFVSRTALTALTRGPVLLDAWPEEPEPQARHVELAQWPDAVVVFPASFSFLGRLALGLTDSPVTLALQCTPAAVAVAPALPPGGTASPAYERHLKALAEHGNFVVVPPQVGVSAATGRWEASVAAPLPEVVAALEERRRALAGGIPGG